ncbi:PREDICTED: 2-oxoglutarate-dependent dioxygenase DAO isoform X4 [Camelina sativa]|uniref:2-oxoglutarate-dependent dioxygenase DAO isoform X3 n=1 Tax=Camelina sativa TaxID=90675 RepID=A0ABM0VNL3_CAMSA|nr:PREDICTED: 2-oxoglutarate-dependent dioxygenase DAO isoform X3 [Camelina sativa]XP_010458893.1 PREDICTED: 2-oxoglutarate-dependent dioxygenase DAO isoform X4 [Camelina sativa]
MADFSGVIIPVIDLKYVSDKCLNQKIREASEEWGCFMVTNHGVPLSLMAEMKKNVRDLHELPCEVKRRNIDVILGTGYKPRSDSNPLYESFGLFDMASPQAVNHFCDQLDASTDQREIMLTYGKAIDGLARDLARRLGESYGVKDPHFFRGWPSQFRMNKYHFKPETVGRLGVSLHTDPGFLTILQGDEDVGGFEVMENYSGSFVPIWSNGRLCNVKHRVKCIDAKVRISISSFLLGPVDSDLEAPDEFVDADHPRLYKPINDVGLKKIRLSKDLHAGESLKFITIKDVNDSMIY